MSALHLKIKKANGPLRCEAGTALLEFAVSVSLLIILFLGAVEVSRYILIVQKIEKTVDTLTDIFTQSATSTIPQSTVAQYLNATSLLMNPYGVGASGLVIFTDISADATGALKANWQVCGGGTLAATSQVAPSGAGGAVSFATAAPNFTMQPNDEVIVGEMFYNVTPLFAGDVVSAIPIYRAAIFRPRFEQLSGSGDVQSTGCP